MILRVISLSAIVPSRIGVFFFVFRAGGLGFNWHPFEGAGTCTFLGYKVLNHKKCLVHG